MYTDKKENIINIGNNYNLSSYVEGGMNSVINDTNDDIIESIHSSKIVP